MAITNSYINATLTTLYTSISETAVTSIIFCNYASSDLTDADTYLDLHIVKNGDVASNENKILHQLKLPAGETFIMDSERLVLANGDNIQAQTTSPATVSVTISTVAV